MPTTAEERLEKQSVELEQEQAAHDQKMARHKVKTGKILLAMVRSAGLLNLSPRALREELQFNQAVRDIAGSNPQNLAHLHREILTFAKSKFRKLEAVPNPPASVVDAAE